MSKVYCPTADKKSYICSFSIQQVTYAEPELITGVGIGGGPLNSRYMGTTGSGGAIMPSPFAPPPPPGPSSSSHYSSSLLNNSNNASAAAAALQSANKFNTIHSSVNKGGRGGGGLMGGAGTPNHYESAADRVVGGSGLKDYTRIGEGGGALLALRERDYHTNNQHHANPMGPSSQPQVAAYHPVHLSTLGRSSSMRQGPPSSHILPPLRNADPTTMLLNTAPGGTAAGTTSAGGSSSSSGTGAGGSGSLLTSNEEVRGMTGSNSGGAGGKRGQDSAYGTTTRSGKKVYL